MASSSPSRHMAGEDVELQASAPELSSAPREVVRSKLGPILTVISSFLMIFTVCGILFSFGVFQELYETLGGPFARVSSAQIDLIGTLAISMMTVGAPFASAWTKIYSPRTISLFGAFVFGAGSILASFGQQLSHFIICQGILMGIGTCLTYIPAMTVMPGWFDKRRGLALGLVSSGTGFGSVVWAPVLRALISRIGFRDTLRLSGTVAFAVVAASAAILKWDPASEQRHRVNAQMRNSRRGLFSVPLVDWRVARSRKFVAQATGAFLQSGAYYSPVFFFSSYARTLGYSAASGANFIALSSGLSGVGKIAIGYLADRTGRLNSLFLTTLVSAIAVLGLWLPSTLSRDDGSGKHLFLAFTLLYGISAGCYISLFPAALVELFGVQHFTSVNGFLYMMRGIGTLIATPTAGALIRKSSSSYVSSAFERMSILIGVLLAGATMAVLWVRLEVSIPGWKWKI